MAIKANYFDGETATNHTISLEVGGSGLRLSGDTIRNVVWSYADLKAVDKAISGEPLRLTSNQNPSARLIVPGGAASEKICTNAPHILGGFNPQKALKTTGWIALSVLIAVGVVYGVLNLAPATIAGLLPDEWRERFGKDTERRVVHSARHCVAPDGQRALLKLAGKVASGAKPPPDFSVRVYDMKMMNAFAVAGGRIVITRGLLKAAETPGEVAGVLAHELGHVKHRHPEASLVRIMGLQMLVSIATGGGGNDTVGSIVSIATLLRYSRGAETEADAYAQKILTNSKIDTVGLKDFFGRVLKLENKTTKNSKIKSLFSILSTHPGTKERIDKLKPLPDGDAIEVLTPTEWKALKNICNKTASGEAA